MDIIGGGKRKIGWGTSMKNPWLLAEVGKGNVTAGLQAGILLMSGIVWDCDSCIILPVKSQGALIGPDVTKGESTLALLVEISLFEPWILE